MGFDSAFQYLNLTLEVFFLDLLLSGDNAVVIALACRSLQVGQRRQAMLIGAGLGIALRILLTSIAGLVLRIPALKLLGGIALTAIAIQLTLDDPEPAPSSKAAGARAGSGRAEILSAIGTVVVADLVMSTDNVIALAAVAKGSVAVLALGLLFSVPLLMFGSWYVTGLLQRYPLLTQCGGALLGWLAGDIAVSDPLYAGWVAHQSPALGLVVPALGAVYVLLQSRIIQQARIGAAALRPVRRVTLAAAKTVPSSHARPQPSARAATAPLPVSIGVVDPPLAFERPAAIALDAAAPLPPERTSPRAKRLPRMVVLGGAGAVALGTLGAVYGFWSGGWMFGPPDLIRYDCPSKGVSLYYQPGGKRIRISNGASSVSGALNSDNQIDWGDYHTASSTLGFVPPTQVKFGNSQMLRIDGGMFKDASCNAAAGAGRVQP